ncbi:hypothetical protein IE53DRAFT_387907 [Violaceomyces palustris]|uniref:Uncharacterized protein n=1 Tax=Violaceomyces palustris TaxID=1673888 RepID=A0ACD0NVG5_9BASI|nr:hypothetical protein IE53DRAFT_387907 [Violaceomyces palustris]
MRSAPSPTLFLASISYTLALSALVILSASCANITLPDLIQCEPAALGVQSVGNASLDIRNASNMDIVLQADIAGGTTSWIWDPVDLPEDSTAIFTLTDRFGPPSNQIAQAIAHGVVLASPSGNTTCLATKRRKLRKDMNRTGGIEIPVVAGVLGGLLLLLLCLIFLMAWRRRREHKSELQDSDSVDGRQRAGTPSRSFAAGGGYMAKLVPGLQPTPPTQRDRSERRRRRMFLTRRFENHDPDLPTYGQSQNDAKTPPNYTHFHEGRDANESCDLGDASLSDATVGLLDQRRGYIEMEMHQRNGADPNRNRTRGPGENIYFH